MRVNDFLIESDTLNAIKKQNLMKRIEIAFDHDKRLPTDILYRLPEKLSTEEINKIVSSKIDEYIRNAELPTEYIPWILGQYINGFADLEDIGGEIVDSLANFNRLKIRGIIKSERQRNISNYKNWDILNRVLKSYRSELEKIKKEREFEKQKRTAKQIILINDDRFLVQIPMNFGSCWIFNNINGVQAKFCTGSSNGPVYFEQYNRNGPLIQILDKKNPNDDSGKWQLHIPTRQLYDAPQHRGSEAFAAKFPGLLKKIAKQLKKHEGEIMAAAQTDPQWAKYVKNWDLDAQIRLLPIHFPSAWDS